jgi:hypothetical protein
VGRHAGVVHEEINATICLAGERHEGFARPRIRNIGLETFGPDSVTGGFGRGLTIERGLGRRGRVGGVIDHQIVAFGGEGEGDAAADAARGAGDQGDGIHGP